MKLVVLFLTPILALVAGLHSAIPAEDRLTYQPWFTGPLLSPTPINMDPLHPAIEPSLTIFNTYGFYNSHWKMEKQDNVWGINPLIDFQFGITKNLGIETIVSSISNFSKGQRATYFQDTLFLLGYQISNNIKGSWVPDFRILIEELFPTGKYQKLNPEKLGIDATGFGSFQTGPSFVVRKLYYLPHGVLTLKWSGTYLFPSSVNVKGFNTYGGGHGTNGTVKPGQSFIAFFSGEYSLNQCWVLAFDSELLFQRKSHFKGKRGTFAPGVPASTELPVSIQISFAPEVECNITPLSGLLGGVWFTVAGRNSNAFASVFFAYLQVF
jgi:hypothetical protein